MAKPSSRADFKEYCLRKLGKPVIEINVDDTQVEDRIDEAIAFWGDYHYDGSNKVYIKYQLTQADIDNGYFTVTDSLIGVVRIFEFSSFLGGSGTLSAKYQFTLDAIQNLNNANLAGYYMGMQHISLFNEILSGKPMIRYNRHINKIYLDVSKDKLTVDMWILIEAYAAIDGDVATDMWADRWLQNYATCLIKEQWGSNLTKFSGLQLPGNVSFNGEQILNDARDERRKIEDEVIRNFGMPVTDFIG